jgi:hypothetical protein
MEEEMKDIVITATLRAWLPSWRSAKTLMQHVADGEHAAAADMLTFDSGDMGGGSDPWTYVGEAAVSVTLQPTDKIVAAQVIALKQQIEHARAEFLQKQSQILEQINKLQALEFSGADA